MRHMTVARSRDASMASYVTVLGLVGGAPGASLVSNKPLDNRSIAPQAKHDVDVLRVIRKSRSS